VAYIVTTRSTAGELVESEKAYGFFHDARRATVALSRGRHGLILQGNFEALKGGSVWSSFIRAATKHTPVLNAEKYAAVFRPGSSVAQLNQRVQECYCEMRF